jgi:hypothetical protein
MKRAPDRLGLTMSDAAEVARRPLALLILSLQS